MGVGVWARKDGSVKPQDQTILHLGENGKPPGNCFAACVASILELPISEVPNFVEHKDWPIPFQEWLRNRGLFYTNIDLESHSKVFGLGILCMFGGYSILSGLTERGTLHSVVGKGIDMIFDPHPSRKGLKETLRVGFFVPIDPAQAVLP